jgi:ferredoxin
LRRIDDGEYRALSFGARMKVFFHGKRSAYAPNGDACRACGLCVVACPESAIRIVQRTATA